VYVFPDRSLTVVSGSYILLAAGSERETGSLAEAFKKMIDISPVTTVFYTGETDS